MRRFILSFLIVSMTAYSAPRSYGGGDGAARTRVANLERAAKLPWTDDGACAVQESSGEWRTLVERCYQALDLSRIRFQDKKHICGVADLDAAAVEEVVGVCLLAQPELAPGVIIIGAVLVGVTIEVELAKARQKKPGCYCSCAGLNKGPDPFGRVNSQAECDKKCIGLSLGYTKGICK